ncbi:hypothetical protein EZV62_006498 [Acer yangbiense]|uniref:Pectinesterase catalytic domain-containing protein n=1 Tax=Acer yangbiense TaxID=1000413 RepID=A0A5C7I6Q0_9ROSI|nr:hypothetical protein EZV62_006498 [Acer yangbiense]
MFFFCLFEYFISKCLFKTSFLVTVSAQWPNLTVAIDGMGDYRSIVEAVGVIPNNSDSMYFIYIKEGNYTENVYIGIEKRNIVMSGDGIGKTNIIFSCSNCTGFAIDQSAALNEYLDSFKFLFWFVIIFLLPLSLGARGDGTSDETRDSNHPQALQRNSKNMLLLVRTVDDEKFYAYSVEGIGLLFNFIYMLVAKATFDGLYCLS